MKIILSSLVASFMLASSPVPTAVEPPAPPPHELTQVETVQLWIRAYKNKLYDPAKMPSEGEWRAGRLQLSQLEVACREITEPGNC